MNQTSSTPRSEWQILKADFRSSIKLVLGLLAVMWAIEIVDQVLLGGLLDLFGIHPRSAFGLVGLLTAPFLHGGFEHLIANSLPFFILGWLVLTRGLGDFLKVSLGTMLFGGLGVWIVGASNSVHIGASGVIFGYLGFLLSSGYFERRVGAILVSLVVFFTYGGLVFGVFPGQCGVSWEGHLFGFLSGVAMAWGMARKGTSRDS